MSRPRIFLTQPVAESAMKRLRAVARVTVFPDDSRIIPHRTLIAAVRKADILFCLLHDKIDRAVVAANPKLRHIAAQSITPSNIDVAEATARGIPVTVVPPVTTEATADLTFGLMLAVARRMVEGDRLVSAGKFPGGQSRHLLGSFVFGKTIGLIGLGRVGSRVARRLAGWDVRLIAYDPYVDPVRAKELNVTLVDLTTLLAESDVVSLHPSLTDETRKMIGEKQLRAMKPTALLINTARGEVADEDAVARAVDERWIAGAALDAFTKEPLPADSPLRNCDPERMILTPHNIAHSEAGRKANLKLALEQILAVARGELPAHLMNPGVVPRWRKRFNIPG